MALNLVQELEKGRKLSEILKGLPLKTQRDEISKDDYQVFIYAAAHSPDTLKELITLAQKIDQQIDGSNMVLELLKNDRKKILETAVEHGHEEAAKHLLEAAENLLLQPKIKANNPDFIANMFKAKDSKLFRLAAEKGHTKVFKFIRNTLNAKKLAPKEMSTWLEALCGAAKNGNEELFKSIIKTIEITFPDELIPAPKVRAAKEKSVLEYQFFDAMIGALEKGKEKIAIGLFDTIFKHEGKEHTLLKSLLTMGETSEAKKSRHHEKNTGKISSPMKPGAASAEDQAKERYEIFITAVGNNCYNFFTQALTTTLNEISPDLAESAIEYTFEDANPEHASDSVLMTLAQDNQDAQDLMCDILGLEKSAIAGAKRESPSSKGPQAKRKSSGDEESSKADEKTEMFKLGARRASLPAGTEQFVLTNMTRKPKSSPALVVDKEGMRGGAFKRSSQLANEGNEGQGARSGGK